MDTYPQQRCMQDFISACMFILDSFNAHARASLLKTGLHVSVLREETGEQ